VLYDILLHTSAKIYKHWQSELDQWLNPMQFSPKLLSEAICFRIDDVARYYFHHSRDWQPSDFPNLGPRYPAMWFEFHQPPRGRLGNKVLDYQAYARKVIGMDVDVSKTIRGVYMRSWDRLNDKEVSLFNRPDIKLETRWLFKAMIFMALEETHLSNDFCGASWQVSGLGEITAEDMSRPYLFSMPDGLVRSAGAENVRAHISGSMLPAFITLSLLQCKNVSTDVIAPVRKTILKRGSRKARRTISRLKPNESLREHHTIVVELMSGRRVSGLSVNPANLGSKSWHEFPGTFRTYGGIDKSTGKLRGKLFGKHSGTWFFSAHTRGDKEVGVISKDYDIKK